jgi:hypothetical protein
MAANGRTYWSVILLCIALVVGCYALIVRPWHAGWGATVQQQTMPLPGDTLGAGAPAVTTRAVTIHAPAGVVWQWLVQIGQGRGGWYSYDSSSSISVTTILSITSLFLSPRTF